MQVELSGEELGMIVTALRIQRERWEDLVMRKIANPSDPDLTHIDARQAKDMWDAHEALLARLPDRGLSL